MERPFTKDTKWLICVWDIRGERPEVTARMMKRRVKTITDTIAACKADGYYAYVKRELDAYDRSNAALAILRLPALWVEQA